MLRYADFTVHPKFPYFVVAVQEDSPLDPAAACKAIPSVVVASVIFVIAFILSLLGSLNDISDASTAHSTKWTLLALFADLGHIEHHTKP